jgi:hypothetical protein
MREISHMWVCFILPSRQSWASLAGLHQGGKGTGLAAQGQLPAACEDDGGSRYHGRKSCNHEAVLVVS